MRTSKIVPSPIMTSIIRITLVPLANLITGFGEFIDSAFDEMDRILSEQDT